VSDIRDPQHTQYKTESGADDEQDHGSANPYQQLGQELRGAKRHPSFPSGSPFSIAGDLLKGHGLPPFQERKTMAHKSYCPRAFFISSMLGIASLPGMVTISLAIRKGYSGTFLVTPMNIGNMA